MFISNFNIIIDNIKYDIYIITYVLCSFKLLVKFKHHTNQDLLGITQSLKAKVGEIVFVKLWGQS